MKVILRQDVPELGKAGQTIDVKDGYGRNFLFPRNLAVMATKANLKSIDEVHKQTAIRDKKQRNDAEKVKTLIEKLSLQIEVNVGEEDKMFGSVTSADIAELMSKEGVVVDKRIIDLESPIKTLGVFTVPVKVDKDVIANCKLLVVKKT